MLQMAGEALARGMGLKPQQVALLFRVGWVLIVTTHIAYVCGLFAWFGWSAAPFASAADMAEIQKSMRVTARISLQQEIRSQVAAWCALPSGPPREAIYQRIESLRIELKQVEPNAEIPPLKCDQ